jgi:uncharacterized membrane protein
VPRPVSLPSAASSRSPSGRESRTANTSRGDALAVGSLVAFTGYWLVSKRVIGVSADSEGYTFGVMLVAAVAMTPVAFLCGDRLGPVRPADWFWLALLALVPGSGHLLFNFAHRFVDVSVSSVVSAGNPIIASLLALLVLGEPLDAVQIAGGIVAVLVIAAVAHQAADPNRARRPAVSRRAGRSQAWPGRHGEQAVSGAAQPMDLPLPRPLRSGLYNGPGTARGWCRSRNSPPSTAAASGR